MFKNSHPFLKISSIFYFNYLDNSNKLAKGIGKFGQEIPQSCPEGHMASCGSAPLAGS